MGSALDTLYIYGVTELYSLIVVMLSSGWDCVDLWHLDKKSFYVDGSYNRDEELTEYVVHIT